MRKEMKFFWFLQMKKTNNINLCQRYLNSTSELNLDKNKRIIDKIANDNINEICWIGDEAVNYPYFLDLIKYAKSKKIKNEILFFDNSFIKKTKKKIIKEIDSVVFTAKFEHENLNNDYKDILKLKKQLLKKTNVKVLTMLNSNNIINVEKMTEIVRSLEINEWIVLSYMPILLENKYNVELLNLPKIRYREISYNILIDYIPYATPLSIYRLSEYTISRKYRIILPNGDVIFLNDKESKKIGNILDEETFELERCYNYKRKYIIPRKNDQKVSIIIANENENIIENLLKILEKIKYVDIMGIARTGKDAFKQVIDKKPDMIFFQYNFKDYPGYEFLLKITEELKLNTPATNILGGKIPDIELFNLIRIDSGLLNGQLDENIDEQMISDVIQEYKKYRDID